MPWVVGIDEAGYGPNLGPLVQAAVALRLPHDDIAGWDTLKHVVRRAHEKRDHRLLIDDSKKVYTRGGLEALERGVWSIVGAEPNTLHDFLWSNRKLSDWAKDLRGEFWFDGKDTIPLEIDCAAEWEASAHVREAFGEQWVGDYRIVPSPQFNRVVDEFGSKAVVLSLGLIELFTSLASMVPDDGEPLIFACDKQGGRNYYTTLIQEAFPEGRVVAEYESADMSWYRVEDLPREVTITFSPRADGDSIAVALASMFCKYLREVCMRQFNRFWAAHVPGIKSTAGYPLDAKRFYEEIRPAMEKLGLLPDQVWRKK